jgi:hypothetical protein
MLDTGTATLHIAANGADYFLIQDSLGYQGMLDTGTAASNLTWEGRLHTSKCYHCLRLGVGFGRRNKVLGPPPTPTRHPAPR